LLSHRTREVTERLTAGARAVTEEKASDDEALEREAKSFIGKLKTLILATALLVFPSTWGVTSSAFFESVNYILHTFAFETKLQYLG
jgi:hypothetical protein